MEITGAMIKELREISGAGMVACKQALSESDGDINKAVDILREKGLAQAAKKATRIASEGLVLSYITDGGNTGVLVEVNSETDFVAKNQIFKSFVEQVAEQAAATKAANIDAFLDEAWVSDKSQTVKDVLNGKIAVIGENLNIRRFEKYEKSSDGMLVSYLHGGGRVAVLAEFISSVQNDALAEAGKNICMQIAAMSPQFVDKSEISDEFIEKEREILRAAALNEGKPANVVDKMIEGRLKKELKEFCLIEQEYVKDNEISVGKYLENVGAEIGSKISIARFTRFETGEGIEKKQENFAEEVSKAMGN